MMTASVSSRHVDLETLSGSFNIANAVRFETKYELDDLDTFALRIFDPWGKKRAGHDAFWLQLNGLIFKCVVLHAYYTDTDGCTLDRVYAFIAEPAHACDFGKMFWTMIRARYDYDNLVTGEDHVVHPFIVRAFQQLLRSPSADAKTACIAEIKSVLEQRVPGLRSNEKKG